MRFSACTILLVIYSQLSVLSAQKVPTFEEFISLRSVSNPAISPDGAHIVYSLNLTNWEENSFESELWISKNDDAPFPLTNTTDGSSRNAQWSPDGKWISFMADRGDQNQIYAIRVAGGEAQQVTNVEGAISDYRWSSDGKRIAYTMTPKEGKTDKDRENRLGSFEVDDDEYQLTSLFTIDFKPDAIKPNERPCHEESDSLKKLNCIQLPEPDTIVHSEDFTVRSFKWSPDGSKMLYSKSPDPLINSFFEMDVAVVDVDSKETTDLITNQSYDDWVDWSPDGKSILYESAVDNMGSVYYANNRLFIMPAEGGPSREVGADFDEDMSVIEWTPEGIYFTAWQKTNRALFRIDPESGDVSNVLSRPNRIFGVSFSDDGKTAAIQARGDHDVNEIYRYDLSMDKLTKLTNQSSLISDWNVSDSEVVSWQSRDGATIEGVLHKPKDFDPNKKYPLLVVIHGGPTGISTPSAVTGYVYPMLQWLDKGAVVLQPNYRGSAGYGQAFRKLNVRNLGVGDAWDVLSGVDYLIDQGMVDSTKMGCMGWSQGGYISAFLTTSTNRFKAISVGAGISNWMTYYVNTDIHPFTRQYLKGTPWDDEEIYRKTSPMTKINEASTPTLIQHGEFDRRVPIANAYELLQGLRDVGVPSKLIVYNGFGHGISKPRERLAALWHNWQWFNQYIWDEETALPFEEEEKD